MSAHQPQLSEQAKASLPTHIAVIMDGNGRWAKQRGLPRVEGHRHGAESVRAIVRACGEIGVKYLTVYAFSVENWSRPKEEVDTLMKLLARYLKSEVAELDKCNVRLEVIGQIYRLPEFVQQQLKKTKEILSKNTGLTVVMALSYGGRTEIVDAVRAIANKAKHGKLDPEEINEQTIAQHLYTKAIPDPDLLIRTSGEMRVSNFLLWQISYAELVVTPVLWPDFRKPQLFEALEEYARRHRRFGGCKGTMTQSSNNMDASSQAQSTKLRTFLRRLLSTVVLWSVIIAAMFFTTKLVADLIFLVIVCVLAAFGLAEFYGLAERRGVVCYKGWGILGGVLLMIATSLHFNGVLGITGTPARVNDFETSFLIIFVLGLCLRQFLSLKNTTGLVSISATLFGLLYVPWLLNFLQKIYYFPSLGKDGAYYIIYFILVTKLSDSGAYAVGSLIGKHKMIPRISPGKTWEGLGGALFGSTAASLVFWSLARAHLPGMTGAHAAILGLLLGGAAVVGDLIESLFKREAGVKDSGNYFPGIGGILDLLDSLLFNAPIMYLYLRHILKNPLFNG